MKTPIGAEEWNELLGTTCGEAIVRVLAPFERKAPELAPPVPDLPVVIRSALRSVGEYPRRLAVVSAGEVKESLARLQGALPEEIAGPLEERLVESFRDQLGPDLWFELRLLARQDGLLGGRHARRWEYIEAVLWFALRGTAWDTFERCLPEAVWRPLRPRLRECFTGALCHRIAYLVADAERTPDEPPCPTGERLAALLHLYESGNFPAGRLRSGDFLVLTA